MIQTADNFGNGRQTPPGFYLEIVARTDFLSANGSMDVWSYTTVASGVHNYEIDGMEEFGDAATMQSNIHNPYSPGGQRDWAAKFAGCPVQGCGGFDLTQYHTYAWRQTSGGTDRVFCAYYDGVLQGCSTIFPDSAQITGLSMLHQMGSYIAPTGQPLGNGSTGKNTWVKSLKVWSCAGLNSGAQCNSSSDNP
jgi:hypothetical protein